MPSCIAYLWNHKLEGFGLILLRTCWRPCAICVARLLALRVRMRVHAIIPLICLAISSCICCRRFPSPMLAHVFSWAVFVHPQELRLCAGGWAVFVPPGVALVRNGRRRPLLFPRSSSRLDPEAIRRVGGSPDGQVQVGPHPVRQICSGILQRAHARATGPATVPR